MALTKDNFFTKVKAKIVMPTDKDMKTYVRRMTVQVQKQKDPKKKQMLKEIRQDLKELREML